MQNFKFSSINEEAWSKTMDFVESKKSLSNENVLIPMENCGIQCFKFFLDYLETRKSDENTIVNIAFKILNSSRNELRFYLGFNSQCIEALINFLKSGNYLKELTLNLYNCRLRDLNFNKLIKVLDEENCLAKLKINFIGGLSKNQLTRMTQLEEKCSRRQLVLEFFKLLDCIMLRLELLFPQELKFYIGQLLNMDFAEKPLIQNNLGMMRK